MYVFANADNGGRPNVRHNRYRLNDGQLLGRLMRCPDVGGVRHTVRSLAAVSGVGKSKLSYMLHGRQMDVSAEQAESIALAVGVRRGALFTPSAFVIANANSNREGNEGDTGGKNGPSEARCAHQLGEHGRPGCSNRSGSQGR